MPRLDRDDSAFAPMIEDHSFNEADVSQILKVWPARFEYCQFKGIKFCELSLNRVSFRDCTFDQCNLTGTKVLGSSFSNIEFIECNLMGVNWSLLHRFEDCNFRGCKLDYSYFQNLKLKKFRCVDCSLKDVDFSFSQLTDSDFSGSVLTGTTFANADLSKANFKTSKDYFIDPIVTKIKGTRFGLPDAFVLLTALGAVIDF
jgi:fluoroquinolone resistance protein